jgi:hypothetical protein
MMPDAIAAPDASAVSAERAEEAQPTSGAERRSHEDRQAALIGPVGRTLLGTLMLVLGAAMLYLVVALWPAIQAATKAGSRTASVTWFGYEWRPTPDAALLTLVVLSSGVGSYVHAAVSFSDYVGNRTLHASWIWWYLLRVFVGSSLAVITYFAIRGGFLGTGTTTTDINPFGIAAVAGFVGLFSKQATDKLREIFDTAFRVEKGGDRERLDGLGVPAQRAEPPSAPAETKAEKSSEK